MWHIPFPYVFPLLKSPPWVDLLWCCYLATWVSVWKFWCPQEWTTCTSTSVWCPSCKPIISICCCCSVFKPVSLCHEHWITSTSRLSEGTLSHGSVFQRFQVSWSKSSFSCVKHIVSNGLWLVRGTYSWSIGITIYPPHLVSWLPLVVALLMHLFL